MPQASKAFIILILFYFMLLAPQAAAVAAAEKTMDSVSAYAAAGVGAGLPQVTSEQFTGKINRLVGAVYGDAVTIAPQITLFICVAGGILSIFWREARMSVMWSIGALILILWAPQLIGLVIHYINL